MTIPLASEILRNSVNFPIYSKIASWYETEINAFCWEDDRGQNSADGRRNDNSEYCEIPLLRTWTLTMECCGRSDKFEWTRTSPESPVASEQLSSKRVFRNLDPQTTASYVITWSEGHHWRVRTSYIKTRSRYWTRSSLVRIERRAASLNESFWHLAPLEDEGTPDWGWEERD